ncbi:MAG: RNA polymerase sigma factor [Myxococcales bacterium]|nr:RNA polymerase sigma factor [Myxococcales bacterium]
MTSEVGAVAGRSLVAALRDGEAWALRQAYDLYGDRLYSFALRLSGRRDTADELFQHAWLRLAENARRLPADVHVLAWLLTVARNHFHSQHRRARTRGQHAEALRDGPREAGAATSPEVVAERRALVEQLESALAALAEPHREILVLMIEGDDLPQHELAEVLGVSGVVFRKRLSRARQALRALLHREEVEDG